jgi:hypothetical protein
LINIILYPHLSLLFYKFRTFIVLSNYIYFYPCEFIRKKLSIFFSFCRILSLLSISKHYFHLHCKIFVTISLWQITEKTTIYYFHQWLLEDCFRRNKILFDSGQIILQVIIFLLYIFILLKRTHEECYIIWSTVQETSIINRRFLFLLLFLILNKSISFVWNRTLPCVYSVPRVVVSSWTIYGMFRELPRVFASNY